MTYLGQGSFIFGDIFGGNSYHANYALKTGYCTFTTLYIRYMRFFLGGVNYLAGTANGGLYIFGRKDSSFSRTMKTDLLARGLFGGLPFMTFLQGGVFHALSFLNCGYRFSLQGLRSFVRGEGRGVSLGGAAVKRCCAAQCMGQGWLGCLEVFLRSESPLSEP